MVDHINKIGGHFVPPVQGDGKTQPSVSPGKTTPFGQVLDRALDQQEVKLSAHAAQRIQMRNIPMDAHRLSRLQNGVNQVAQKGGRESLVLLDQSAFLVSVPNRTVITAIDQTQIKNNVFTNIDSAIIV